ncbi:hypothetical protein, partial [Vibrio comitans]
QPGQNLADRAATLEHETEQNKLYAQSEQELADIQQAEMEKAFEQAERDGAAWSKTQSEAYETFQDIQYQEAQQLIESIVSTFGVDRTNLPADTEELKTLYARLESEQAEVIYPTTNENLGGLNKIEGFTNDGRTLDLVIQNSEKLSFLSLYFSQVPSEEYQGSATILVDGESLDVSRFVELDESQDKVSLNVDQAGLVSLNSNELSFTLTCFDDLIGQDGQLHLIIGQHIVNLRMRAPVNA